MYPFLKQGPQDWDKFRLKRSYKMNGLWPWGVVRRHMCFQQKFRLNKNFLFKEYEEGGGEYHGSNTVKQPVIQECTTIESDTDDAEFV